MLTARSIAFLITLPFVAVFAYATWQEYKRYKSEGKTSYGLTYDAQTNTTHVGAISGDEDSYDPQEFDPEMTDAINTDETDNTEQETRT